jgi:hypothetical protein
MRFLKDQRRWLSLALRGSARGGVCCAMILSFLLANFGYPVWEPVQKAGPAFPCQFSRCGCQSADQCSQNCCCAKKAKFAVAKKSCCTKGKVAKAERTQVRWVVAISARECQGTGVDWIQAGFVATPPRPVELAIAVPENILRIDCTFSYLAPSSERLFRPA